MVLYHLDRNRSLITGMPINPIPESEIPEDLKETILYSKFEHGLSKHGLNYLNLSCNTFPYLHYMDGRILFEEPYVDESLKTIDSQIIELTAELVRSAYFPQYPSRYESLFAVRSIQDFYQWPELCDRESFQNARIFEIEAPNETHGFDSKWLRGGISRGISNARFYIAHASAYCFDFAYKYWSQVPSDSPRWEYLIPLPIDGTRVRLNISKE